ncbi:uncharacterized protein DUF4296 [Mucilaginibacter frigoritolerans]|uniref:Uncharacterized protein DUF4296 n=1 Tax=Mucilaginibacter frigoritolerans TaxID=652788 RepID=A0A562TX04_9SPHI|nr:DUF4296 domain-containing protein [Mucilaginibacter frigoritolerans]TWI98067.1 uncharacterized protein DUF4296 [Mucilaginibacter frigoritolerans]
MRKYITLFFSVTFFLYACKGDKTPAGIIKHDQMVSLLTDVHIIDGSLYSVQQTPDTLYKYGSGKYRALFKRYGIDTAQFRRSMKYYASQPTEMGAMYDQILANLKVKIDSLNKIQSKNIQQKQNALSPNQHR